MRPVAGVVDRALEIVEARDLGLLGGGEAPRRQDQPGRLRLPRRGPHPPQRTGRVPGRRLHPRLEPDVAAQVETVGHVIRVGQDLGLGGVALGPAPVALQVRVPGIGILHRFHVAARARVAVPEPGAADAGPGLERHGPQAHAAQAVKHVHAAETGPDHDGVEALRGGGCAVLGHVIPPLGGDPAGPPSRLARVGPHGGRI